MAEDYPKLHWRGRPIFAYEKVDTRMQKFGIALGVLSLIWSVSFGVYCKMTEKPHTPPQIILKQEAKQPTKVRRPVADWPRRHYPDYPPHYPPDHRHFQDAPLEHPIESWWPFWLHFHEH